MSAESDLLDFKYPDYTKVLCDGIIDLYKTKAWTDLALKVTGGCETLVHTFMLSLFAPKLISHCEDNKCDLQGFNVDQDTISTLLDFIYNGQVTVERHRLDSIRRGADLLGLNVLSQLISEETKQDSIDSLSIDEESKQDSIDSLPIYEDTKQDSIDSLSIDEESKQDSIDSLHIETETNEQIIPPINCDKPPTTSTDAILRCSRCDFKLDVLDGYRELLIHEFKDHLAKVHHVDFDQDALKISYKCRDCDFEGKDRKVLKNHRRSRHSKQTFKCCNCDFVTDKMGTVIRHLRFQHPSEKSFKCPECDFHTLSEKQFKVHQRMEHNTGKHECDECGRRFATHAGKRLHYKRIHLEPEDRNACYLCSFKTKVRAELKQHLAETHNVRQMTFYNDKQQCPHCETVLNTKTHLIDHLAGKHKVDLEGNPVEPKYKCKSCDFVAYWYGQLHRHNYSNHLNVELRCNHCEFKCRGRRLLTDHIRWKHSGENPYICEVCGQSFGTSNHLSRHRKLHSETKSKQFDKETTLQVVEEEGENIRENNIAVMEVENYELVVEQAEPT